MTGRRILLLIFGAAVLLGSAGAYLALRWWQAPLALPEAGLRIRLDAGESLGHLSSRLARAGVLRRPRLLNIAARIGGVDQQLRRGEYQLPAGSSPADLLALLRSGEVVRYRVTLPEGITLAQALQRLQSAPALRLHLVGPGDRRLLALVAPHADPEGLFLPETYQYRRGDSDLDVLAQAHGLMRTLLAELWASRRPDLPYDSPYEALVLASIVERETGVAAERARIAGVFLRRLQRGMRLQTDPAVIYGLGAAFDGNLTRAHLRDPGNRYNTYRHRGLPPTPIALPGRAALRAAFDPAPGEALYFVARGDGSHHFSRTLEEHQRAVREYQLKRRDGYRSAPLESER